MTRPILRGALVSVAAASIAAPGLANTVSTNAIQLTTVQAANAQTGVTQGGQFAIQGTGLNSITIPSIDAAGVVSVNNTAGFTTNINETFNYTATIRQADTQNAIGAIGTLNTGTFSDTTTKSSVGNGAGTLASLSISNVGIAALSAGTGAGQTATGIISTTAAGRYSQVENRRIVSSSNTQNITDSDVQQAKMVVKATGMSAVTNGGFSSIAGAAGTVVASTDLAGGGCGAASSCNNGTSFNIDVQRTASQTALDFDVTSTSVNKPAYGIVDHSVGGTTAGAITISGINTVGVTAGGAGTSASLSMVGEMTAFN